MMYYTFNDKLSGHNHLFAVLFLPTSYTRAEFLFFLVQFQSPQTTIGLFLAILLAAPKNKLI